MSVDPGKWKLGIALWLVVYDPLPPSPVSSLLLTAGTVTAPKIREWNPEAVALRTEEVAKRWVTDRGYPELWSRRIVVAEWPRKYEDRPLYHEACEQLRAVCRKLNTPIRARFAPSTWKGNVPKEQHHARVRKALTLGETQVIRDTTHDTLDAIGIGLYALGRTKKGAVTL